MLIWPIAMVLTNFVAMGLSLGFAVKSSGEDRQAGHYIFYCMLAWRGIGNLLGLGILLRHKKSISASSYW